jgi:ribonuclease BN (tRNA processing enzyme)
MMRFVEPKQRALELTTREVGGHLRAAWLGVGSAFASASYQSNVLLIKGDQSILVDCGTSAANGLTEIGLTPLDVQALLPTHSHADHVGGIEELALKHRYFAPIIKGGKPGDYRPHCIVTDYYETMLWENSLKGGLGWSESHNGNHLNFKDFFQPVHPQPVEGAGRAAYRTMFGGIDIMLIRTMHFPEQGTDWSQCAPSYGLIVDNRVLFSGDTRFDRALIDEFVTDSIETVFHDCQSWTGGIHAGYEQLKTLPESVRGRMVLVHLDDGMLKLDPDAAATWTAAAAAHQEVLRDPKATPDDLCSAQLAVDAAKRVAHAAAERIAQDAGFAGFARPATAALYDFV